MQGDDSIVGVTKKYKTYDDVTVWSLKIRLAENTCKVSNVEGNDDLGIYQHCHHSLKHEETDKNTNTGGPQIVRSPV